MSEFDQSDNRADLPVILGEDPTIELSEDRVYDLLAELHAEVPHLIDRLLDLETILSLETQLVKEGDFDTLAKIKIEKDARVPDLQRANTVLQAIKRLEGDLNLEEDDDLYDLAVTLVNINKLAAENEQVIVGAIRASQYNIRAVVQAMRKSNDSGLHRYSRTGNVISMNGANTVPPQEL
ncbi:MAG: hypothetical protein QM523_00745 [Candidatus Pacebacteria bacterium]|nr:hypothetical protein [Candidatus Paceibacterota bacterium]